MIGFDMYHLNPTDGDNTWLESFKEQLSLVQQFATEHDKLMAVTETGVASTTDEGDTTTALHKSGNEQLGWYQTMLDTVSASNASYFMLWANFSETSGFYTPYVKSVNENGTLYGHEMLDYFIEFYNDPRSIFAIDQQEILDSDSSFSKAIANMTGDQETDEEPDGEEDSSSGEAGSEGSGTEDTETGGAGTEDTETGETGSEESGTEDTEIEGAESEDAEGTGTESTESGSIGSGGNVLAGSTSTDQGQNDSKELAIVTADELNDRKGKKKKFQLQLQNGVSWTINGQDITGVELVDVNLWVTLNSTAIAEDEMESILNESFLEEEYGSVQLISIDHTGSFGFCASLVLPVDEENVGSIGSIYWINESTGKAEFVTAVAVTDQTITVQLSSGSNYFIIYGAEAVINEEVYEQIDVSIAKKKINLTKSKTKKTAISILLPDSLQKLCEEDLITMKVKYKTSNKKVAIVSKACEACILLYTNNDAFRAKTTVLK